MFKYLLKWKRSVMVCKMEIPIEDHKPLRFGGMKGLNTIFEYELSEELLRELSNVFRTFVMQFQVKEVMNTVTFRDKIKAYNKKASEENAKWGDLSAKEARALGHPRIKKLNLSRMEGIYYMLLSLGNWDAIRKKVPKPTFYRYRKDFELIGMDKTYIAAETFNVSTDFDKYLEIESTNYNKLKTRFI